jgi:hypothetical protein
VGEVFFGLAVTIVLQIVAARRYPGVRFSSNWYELSRLRSIMVWVTAISAVRLARVPSASTMIPALLSIR